MAGRSKILIALAAVAGVTGCAYQDPFQVPNPYATHGAGAGAYSPYYFYGGMGTYRQYYGYGAADPYSYYRYGYPTYGYYSYPRYPVYYCADANRDGRCDRNDRDHGDDDHDGDHDGHNGPIGDHDGRGNDNSGAGPGRDRDHDRPVVRRDREPERFVPGSRGTQRPVPRANSSSNTGAAVVVPRPPPPVSKEPPDAPRTGSVPPRSTSRPDDQTPPRLRRADSR
jgi:hypothetical protein